MNLDLSKINKVHFIGIGGIGISAIARMMLKDGKKVTGQDMQESEVVSGLQSLGAEITIGQSFENIPLETELIVYTIAIETYDPELFKKIKEGSIPVYSYPEMLGVVSKDKYTIAVAGTHGKTTTTGMITQVLRDNKKDPTVIIGSLLVGEKSNFVEGKSDYFVVEACEYRRSFLNVNPKILVITNIEEDHLDYYKDIEDIKSAFHVLAMKVPNDGYVICNLGSKNIHDVISGISATVIDSKEYFNNELHLKIPGRHNRENASSAVAVASILGISTEEAEKSLGNFPGTWKRFEYKGILKTGTLVYDDYAHHPTEIRAAIDGFRELYKNHKLTVVFQPHLFSRTKSFLKEFAESLRLADCVLILPIYYAREVDDGTVSSIILADEIGEKAQGFKSFEEAEGVLKNLELTDKDIVVTMGAGEAFKVGDNLLSS